MKNQPEYTTVSVPTVAFCVTGLDPDVGFNVHVRGCAIVLLSDDLIVPDIAQTILGLQGLADELQDRLTKACSLFDYDNYDYYVEEIPGLFDDAPARDEDDDTTAADAAANDVAGVDEDGDGDDEDDDNNIEIAVSIEAPQEDMEKMRQALESMSTCLSMLGEFMADEENSHE